MNQTSICRHVSPTELISIIMKPMAIFSHAHPDFSRGGGEIVAYQQFLSAAKSGQTSIFFFPISKFGNTSNIYLSCNDDVFEYRKNEFAFKCKTFDPLLFNHRSCGFFDDIAEIVKQKNIEILHFHHFWRIGPNLIIFLREFFDKKYFIFTAHEFLTICPNDGQMLYNLDRSRCVAVDNLKCAKCVPRFNIEEIDERREFFLEFLQIFDLLISPSIFLREIFYSWGLRKKMFVIENGNNMPPGKSIRDIGPDIIRKFGFFGQPTSYKGLEVFVSAALYCKMYGFIDIKFYVYGCTEDKFVKIYGEPARIALDNLSNHIIFCGPYNHKDVTSLMTEMGYIVVPSIWWENSPLVIQEAFLSRRPLIVSDIGGMKEKVIDGLNGIHFIAGDGHDLASKIVDLSQNISIWHYLKSNIPKVINAHSNLMIIYNIIYAQIR